MRPNAGTTFAFAVALLSAAVALPALLVGSADADRPRLTAGGFAPGTVILLLPFVLQLLAAAWLVMRVRTSNPDRNDDALWLAIVGLAGLVGTQWRRVEALPGSWAESLVGINPLPPGAVLMALMVLVVLLRRAPASQLVP